MQQLVRVEPVTEPVTAPDGAIGWRQTIPDTNKYNLKKTFQFCDDRITSPLQGYNTQVWLVEGDSGDIDRLVSDNASVVTKLTPVEAKTLADSICPAKTWACLHCGGTGQMVRAAWVSPI